MAEAQFPYMPLYWKDWLTGQSTTVMTAEQEGAFLNLLLRAWGADPPCTLPDDDARLAQLSKLGSKWRRAGAIVREQFESVDGGLLRNRKQFSVYQDMLKLRSKRSDAGKKGNEKRWRKDSTEVAEPSQRDRKPIAKTSPAVAVAVSVAENGEQHTGDKSPEAAPRVEQTSRKKADLPDMTRKQFCGLAAPLIRDKLWLSDKPPAGITVTEPLWDIGRELNVAIQLAGMYRVRGEDILGIIGVARETTGFAEREPISMRLFLSEHNGPANFRDCLAAWQKLQRRARNGGLEPATFDELAASMRASG